MSLCAVDCLNIGFVLLSLMWLRWLCCVLEHNAIYANPLATNMKVMIFKYINRFQQLEQLIRLQNTGNAEELGNKLGISKRHVYRLIEEFKDLGLEIEYSKYYRSFVYRKKCKVEININIEILSDKELIEVDGGYGLNILCYNMSQIRYLFA